jgi:DNA polymerase III subunit epsilon
MQGIDFTKPWTEYTFVAFDTETSGAYPIGDDIVEFGAVKWQNGKITDELQLLIKPRELMSDFIIGIHGITNEMVANAPPMAQVIQQIDSFMHDHILMAHHAPFDLGFLAVDYEKYGLAFPAHPALCTSILSRKLIYGCENHRLQTLVRYLGIEGGTAHRALDDARACLHVGLKSFEKLGPDASLESIFMCQATNLYWKNYIVRGDSSPLVQKVIEAVESKLLMEIVYGGAPETRQIKPLGLVRNPDGDYVYAFCLKDKSNKRFYLPKIKDSAVIY